MHWIYQEKAQVESKFPKEHIIKEDEPLLLATHLRGKNY